MFLVDSPNWQKFWWHMRHENLFQFPPNSYSSSMSVCLLMLPSLLFYLCSYVSLSSILCIDWHKSIFNYFISKIDSLNAAAVCWGSCVWLHSWPLSGLASYGPLSGCTQAFLGVKLFGSHGPFGGLRHTGFLGGPAPHGPFSRSGCSQGLLLGWHVSHMWVWWVGKIIWGCWLHKRVEYDKVGGIFCVVPHTLTLCFCELIIWEKQK